MDSVQLDLWVDVVRLPWYGRAPRTLTRRANALFLRREPQKDDNFFVDPYQFDLFPAAKPMRWVYPGASTLCPLPPEGK